MSSDNTVGGLQQVIKQRFTKPIKPPIFCGIKIVQVIFFLLGVQFVVQFLELKVHFRHLFPQLGLPQLLEDVVGKDANECCKCCGDRGVPNCKLTSP